MTPQALAKLNQQYLGCLARGDWAGGLALAVQALAALPGHPQILGDLALCQMRLGQLDAAQASYAQALAAQPDEANFYDGLAELHGLRSAAAERGELSVDSVKAEREAVCAAGLRALALKDARHAGLGCWALPDQPPPALSAQRERNVIAYTLFGDNPRYCETLLLNLKAAATFFPEWSVRVYGDATVPAAVRERLQAGAAEWVDCSGDAWRGVHPLMWRFAVMEDAAVDRWLIRDADSLLSTREQAAVQAWLASGKWFHMMRDYYTHTELLLAGLLGGCGGVFHGLMDRMRAFAASHVQEQRVVDQHFLRHEVWPTVRQSLLPHDNWFGFMDAQPFPEHAPIDLDAEFHVGSNLSSASIGVDGSALADGAPVTWRLIDHCGATVCSYTARVQSGAWRAALPMPYIRKLQAGQWRIV